MTSRELGNYGEKIAEQYLKKRRYKIIDQNVRLGRHGELDIIAHKDQKLIFIEIKTRQQETKHYPRNTWVSNEKEERIYKLSSLYRRKNAKKLSRLHIKHIEFDMIAITIKKREGVGAHYERAFGSSW